LKSNDPIVKQGTLSKSGWTNRTSTPLKKNKIKLKGETGEAYATNWGGRLRT